ncbi:MAG TPA: hypothetical protein VFA94_13415 [Acidimicrobiales bacterium]|nr:hypothetical protein [Acidimicrobiales bacterium]
MTGDDCGQVGGIEGLVFGVLIFVLGTLVVVNAWNVVDAKLAVTAAAREAARAYVEAPDEASANGAAQRAAAEALQGHGRRPERMEVTRLRGTFARCSRVVLEVRYPVPLAAVPLIGAQGGLTVTARHAEVVDPYRNGLAGAADCAGA